MILFAISSEEPGRTIVLLFTKSKAPTILLEVFSC